MAEEDVANDGGVYNVPEEASTSPEEFVKAWMDAIRLASQEEHDWRESADRAAKMYRAAKDGCPAFNILHSNVETIVPALYNSTPVPDVRSRYGDRDPTAEGAARLMERALTYDLDDQDFDAVAVGFSTHMQVVGRGVARVAWQPIIHQDETGARVVFDAAPVKLVPWRDFRRGPGLSWDDVPFVAYRHWKTQREVEEIAIEGLRAAGADEQSAGEALAAMLNGISFSGSDHEKEDADKSAQSKTVMKRAEVWEIWSRDSREVIYIASSYQDAPIAVLPDPLGLIGFFDTPRPLQAINDTDRMIPVVPYEVYAKQADELDRVSKRILKLVEQLKFRGIYAGEVTELEGLSKLNDGEFVPSQGALTALSQTTGGLQNAIWTAPIDTLIVVLKELLLQREQIKQAIYEITGIADILRGSTNPNETARAQSIKAQWGSLRIQRAQAEVQRYCRDLFRLKAEVIAAKFGDQTLEMINGDVVDQKVMAMVRSDYMRRCKVDIETDSTIQADQERARANMTEFLGMSAQFMQIAVPAAKEIPMLAPALIEVYMATASKLKLGKKAEEALAAVAQQIQQAAAEQKQQAEQNKEKQAQQAAEAEELQRRGAIANVTKLEGEAANEQADAAKTQAETQKIGVETARLTVEPIVQPMPPGEQRRPMQ